MRNCGYTDRAGYIPVHHEDMTDVGLWSPDQNFASVHIGMSLLAISEDTLEKLEEHRFTCITVAYPHAHDGRGCPLHNAAACP